MGGRLREATPDLVTEGDSKRLRLANLTVAAFERLSPAEQQALADLLTPQLPIEADLTNPVGATPGGQGSSR